MPSSYSPMSDSRLYQPKCSVCQNYLSANAQYKNRKICYSCSLYIKSNKKEKKQGYLSGTEAGLLVVLKRRISNALQRAKNSYSNKFIGSDITMSHLIYLYEKQNGQCALSGRKLSLGAIVTNGYERDVLSIDRIDPSKGYVIGNVQLTTYQVNTAKGRHTDEEFIRLCREIVEKHGRDPV